MRLINARRFLGNGTDFFKEVYDEELTPYAIISHRWEEEEVLYQDVIRQPHPVRLQQRKGYLKIKNACKLAIADRLTYIWVDTCCIDKSSSSELQEAINSMFRWYAKAIVCYVYLSDLGSGCPTLNDTVPRSQWLLKFQRCTWFTRGWTLQEVLAPKQLYFHSEDWQRIGSILDLVRSVSNTTGIETAVLLHEEPLRIVSIARRMSWAALRQTTRLEDRAYSLLGIFDVNMPMLYGEREKAFTRLQEEICKTSNDQSIFAWDWYDEHRSSSELVFAKSPNDFLNISHGASVVGHFSIFEAPNEEIELTKVGLRLTTYLVEFQHSTAYNTLFRGPRCVHYAAVLNGLQNHDNRVCALKVRRFPARTPPAYYIDDGHCDLCKNQAYQTGRQGDRLVYLDSSNLRGLVQTTITILRKHTPLVDVNGHEDGTSVQIIFNSAYTLEILDVWPRNLWDMESATMRLGKSFLKARNPTTGSPSMQLGKDFVRGAMTLRHESGQNVNLVVEAVKHVARSFTYHAGFVDPAAHQAACDGIPIYDSNWLATKQCKVDSHTIEILPSESLGRHRVFEISMSSDGIPAASAMI